jgi:hypothetical protein
MTPRVKLHVVSATIASVFIALNWFRSVTYDRTNGITAESFSPVALAALISGALALYLTMLCVRSARVRIESGRGVGEGRWIQSWLVIVYALPLLWHQNSTSVRKEVDGAMATVTGGYGHDLSTWVFIFTVIGLYLFQIYVRLSTDEN